MNSKSVLRFLLPVVVLSFLLGILSVLVFDAPGPASQTSGSPGNAPSGSPRPPNDPGRTTVLVVGIDSFETRSPKLLAVWWATFSSFDDEIALFGVPTNASSQATSRPLADIFELNSDHSPTSEFLNALDFLAPHYPNVILVLDEVAFAQLIDFMGGAVLDGQVFNGQSIVESLRFLEDDPQMQLSMQASLLLTLSFQGARLNENPEITTLTSLIPEHAYSSIPPTTLVNILIPILPLDPATIHIEVWQP